MDDFDRNHWMTCLGIRTSLPYGDPDRLVMVWQTNRFPRVGLSYPNFLDWQRSTRSFEQMPDKSRSKLEPHADVIRELRRKGRTYEEIAQFFAERFGIKVAPSTIHAFVRVRARRRQRPLIELPGALNGFEPTRGTETQNNVDISGRIEALKRQRPPEEVEKPQFRYDENEPLELIQNTSEAQRSERNRLR